MEEIFILIAEDDADDRFLLQAAFDENLFKDRLHFVENGVELMNYLHDLTQNGQAAKMPHFILLDLNMPKKDGREVLREIKQHPLYKKKYRSSFSAQPTTSMKCGGVMNLALILTSPSPTVLNT